MPIQPGGVPAGQTSKKIKSTETCNTYFFNKTNFRKQAKSLRNRKF